MPPRGASEAAIASAVDGRGRSRRQRVLGLLTPASAEPLSDAPSSGPGINIPEPSDYSAGYDVSATPRNWRANQSQTYTIKVTNNGNRVWPKGGTNPVHLGVHFACTGGGQVNNDYCWTTISGSTFPTTCIRETPPRSP